MLPVTLLRLPYSLLEAVVWSIIVYWSVGFAPDAGRVRRNPGSKVLLAVLAESVKLSCLEIALLHLAIYCICERCNRSDVSHAGRAVLLVHVHPLPGAHTPMIS